jgi:hypothetical protein
MEFPLVQTLLCLLIDGLNHPTTRGQTLRKFQEIVFQTPGIIGEKWVSEVFRDLAYDLDFYEPNPEIRREDPSLYGDERVEDEIRSSLKTLKENGIVIPLEEP